MAAKEKKYYLVLYTFQPLKGTPIDPYCSQMYEFDIDKSPIECYEYINEDINKGGRSDNEFEAYYCKITNIKRIE